MDNTAQPRLKPFIIPVFIPHAGCPHRCVFCDQSAITGQGPSLPNLDVLARQVHRFLAFRRRKGPEVQIAFYGGNFLGLPEKTVRSLLEGAERFIRARRVDSIRFSTRPDTIDDRRLQWLTDIPVAAIELGAQSLDDRVLTLSNRGHSAADTQEAVGVLKQYRFHIGLQLMPGLPGDDGAASLESAQKAADLFPDFVRIYPTVVLKESPLARLYLQGSYRPLSLEAAVALTRKILAIFEAHSIPVVRMGLQASQDLDAGTQVLAGPYHPAFGQLVHAERFLEKARVLLQAAPNLSESITLAVHPRSLSRLQGIRRRNMNILREEFGLRFVAIRPDDTLAGDDIRITA